MMEKETWIIPCNYVGTLTVYFNSKTKDEPNYSRTYKFDSDGVFYSSLSTNDGFTPDFNQTFLLKSDCNTSQKKILFFDSADSSKLKSGETYATYFLTGKDSLYCESILILKKK